jgi:outer membrane protein TolC
MKKKFMFIVNLTIIAVFTFNIVFTGYAQEVSTLQLGLDETIKRALDTSEELKIKEQEIRRAQGGYQEVRSGALPHLTAESTWTHNLNYPDSAASSYSDHEFNAGVSATQVLWSFGKIAYAVNAAKKAVEASRFNKESGKQEIIYTAKLSYYSSLLARNALSITEKSYANALENKRLLGQRTYGGRSSKYEIIRMNSEVAARVPTVNEARTQFDAATETLRKIIDVDLDCKIELAGDFLNEYEDFNYETLVVAMNEYEPSLQSFSKTIESAEEKVKSKYASFFPTLSAFGSWSYLGGSNEHPFLNNNELDNYSLAGFKVSIPIWEGGEKQAQLSQSKAEQEIAVLRKKQLSKNLLLELKKAHLEYQQYKENLKANIEAVDLAEESFKQTQEMFASSLVTLTDLNDAELLLTNQRLNKESTLFYINITLAKIEKLIVGQYDEQSIHKKS